MMLSYNLSEAKGTTLVKLKYDLSEVELSNMSNQGFKNMLHL